MRQGIAFGLLLVAIEVVGPLLPGPGRTIALDVVGPLVGSAWAWALFAGWLGRGARTGWWAASSGALGLLAASLVRNVADAVTALARGASFDQALERLTPNLAFWVAGPLVLGVMAGLLGWLTTRRDALGAAAGVVLGLGLSGTIAAGLPAVLRGHNAAQTVTSAVVILLGLAFAARSAYAAVRRQSAYGPEASVGAPETPIRHYSPPGRWQAYAPEPTQAMPAHDDDPTEQFPAAPQTPSDPWHEGDIPTRANPLRRR
ncbi:hypothetical protein GCM10028815_12170 [Mariniluteicoccus flavus]